ncbi:MULTISPECIES: anthranilate synthase component I [unclassified Ketobacter]|uniref:anthranilate synthase component I n=1 Tax=unclassified Ketobacter TaxID=2639109 RepID=UPI000F0EA04A|nr:MULTISPECIES: anthranilate synthase component I [unclassified Ketobacter]RLT87911.1 MAG: anthranilate synthase component I [Ketobacter sp. GenoA1]RLT93307.1 MAG: anthranilate synthase component I [Ketobacter sp.]
MTPETFQALAAQGYTRIPLMREALADLETPLSTYKKLAGQPYTYLFESVQGGEKWGRYSIIGLPCSARLVVRDREITLLNGDTILEQKQVDDPLAFIESFQARYKVPEVDGLPRFNGGLVGYFGYDIVRYIEQRLDKPAKPDPIGTPDIMLMVSDDIVVFDNLRGSLYVITHVDPAQSDAYVLGQARLDAILQQLKQPLPVQEDPHRFDVRESDFKSSFPQPEFEQAVEDIKEFVLAGDTMQVVISQRMSIPYDLPPLDLYRALRCLNPSPYMYFLDMGDFQIAGSSPEILARVEQGVVTVRPIAGTRRRGKNAEDDLAMEAELLADPKEIAEHLMLIDLGRNDVGRIAEIGTVALTDKMVVERYSHVMHIVSNVEGKLKPEHSCIDVLRATHPAGTLSGAPKIRAMEIIHDIEPVKRGVYGGAVGYLSWHGDMDTAIAIRTAVIKDGQLHIQAGAGVVADSVPRLEWKETQNKARAVFRAMAMAANGLVPVEE